VSCLNRISKQLTFLAVHRTCCGKKVFGKKEEEKSLLREFCGGEVYIPSHNEGPS
jgi:hypothetical protein